MGNTLLIFNGHDHNRPFRFHIEPEPVTIRPQRNWPARSVHYRVLSGAMQEGTYPVVPGGNFGARQSAVAPLEIAALIKLL